MERRYNVPRSSDDDLPFNVIAHFQIIARIGQGGMGDVYKGYEEALDRYVAIKVLPSELARQEDFVRRFHAEATAVAQITHPNVVPIHFIGEHEGHHFFAMQFVEGESLADLLGRRGRLRTEETLAIIEQVLSGLAVAHTQGIVHRDIKPGNILLDRENGQALLADFGLVKSIESGTKMTATGVIMGTVDYVSPEQGRGQDVDARSDLYSTGVLIYQMLSGSLPFEADSPTAMIFQHVYEEPKPLKKAAPDVPGTLCTVIHKLLAKSADNRHQTAEDVLADLRAFRTGQPLPSTGTVSDASPIAPAARPQTQIIETPRFDEGLSLPIELAKEAPLKWWQRGRNRLLDFVRRRTPEFVQRLQDTQHQVDGAVVEYERRRDSLRQLVSEAVDVVRELRRQAEDHRQGAAAAERRAESAIDADHVQEALAEKTACQESADELAEQIAEQEKQLETIQLRLAKVNATLETVRGQRDVLNARLKVAQVQVDLATRSPKRALLGRVLRIGAVVAVGGLATLAAVVLWTSSKPADLGEQVVPVETGTSCLAFMPTALPNYGFGFAVGNRDGSVTLFAIHEDGEVRRSAHLFGHIEKINAIAFSPDGTQFVTGSNDGTIRCWDTTGDKSRKELWRVEAGQGRIVVVLYSPDGTQILSGAQDGMIQLWDVDTQTEIKKSKVSTLRSCFRTMDWSRDGKHVLLGAKLHGEDSMSLWSLVENSEEIVFYTNDRPTSTVAFSHSGDQAYSVHSGSICVYDLTSDQVSRQFGANVRRAAFSVATQRVLSADESDVLTLWDTETGKVIQGFTANVEGIYLVALSADGTKGLGASEDGTIRVWDLPPSLPRDN